jgi:CheY-like chemotaxis protein
MCRVLIIDDEEAICRVLISSFSLKGIASELATNGPDGLDKFNQEHFDIVITDMVMPGMDGTSIARQIRSSAKPDTPIIGISGTPWLLDEGDFDAVFQKPFSLNVLVDTVKALTSASAQAMA